MHIFHFQQTIRDSTSEDFLSSSQGFILPDENTHFTFIHHYSMHGRIIQISFMLRTSLLGPYHALYMTDLYLSGRIQLNSQSYFKTLGPYLVQLDRLQRFLWLLSSQRPSLVQLNRLPTYFSDEDSVEVFRFFSNVRF